MYKKTLIAAGLGLALSSAAQAEYQFELGANTHTGDIEVGTVDADRESFGLTGTYYLNSVNTDKGPLAEAAFLDRASSIQIDLSTGEIDGDGGKVDIDSYSVDSRLVSKETGWLVDLGYRFDEIENNDEFDTFSIGAGKYVLENTAVVLSYAKSDADLGDDADTYGLGVEHLWHLAQGAIKLDASIARIDAENSDDVDVWGLGGTYYVTPKLGFGANYSLADSDETELENWSLFAKWFVTEQIELSLAYTEQEDDEFDFESDAIMFNANVRF
jgi:hypothetical protein